MTTEADVASGRVRLQPAGREERISSIDVLRGAALLGIALMNVVFSGLPAAADFNPRVSGGASGLNLAAFCLQYVLFDGKMRGLFSMMFGASAWLLVERGRKRGAGIEIVQSGNLARTHGAPCGHRPDRVFELHPALVDLRACLLWIWAQPV